MTISFKQFTTFLDKTQGTRSPEKLEEIWDSIIKKNQTDKEETKRELTAQEKKTKGMVLSAAERMQLRKEEGELRKKELQKKRDVGWLDAKEKQKGPAKRGDRDDAIREGKTSYSEEGYWKDDAKAAGYKVKKLSGELMTGDQTWGAFKDDKKVGEFTEKEDGRGGWLITEAKKTIGFFGMDDAKKVEKFDLEKAKEYLRAQVEKTAAKADPANVRKAHAMIDSARSVKNLMFGVANFMLAVDGKKVIR